MKKILMLFICMSFIILLSGCVKEKEKIEDKKPVINLNDKIYYIAEYELNGKDCGGYAFPANVNDIINARWISSYNGMKEVDKIELFSHSDIEYDKELEAIAKEEWNTLKEPSRGVSQFELGYADHQFYLGYTYIKLVKDVEGNKFKENDKYYDIAQEIQEEIFAFKTKARTIISSRDGYHLKGTCGKATEVKILDEKVCDEYKLDCGRW